MQFWFHVSCSSNSRNSWNCNHCSSILHCCINGSGRIGSGSCGAISWMLSPCDVILVPVITIILKFPHVSIVIHFSLAVIHQRLSPAIRRWFLVVTSQPRSITSVWFLIDWVWWTKFCLQLSSYLYISPVQRSKRQDLPVNINSFLLLKHKLHNKLDFTPIWLLTSHENKHLVPHIILFFYTYIWGRELKLRVQIMIFFFIVHSQYEPKRSVILGI